MYEGMWFLKEWNLTINKNDMRDVARNGIDMKRNIGEKMKWEWIDIYWEIRKRYWIEVWRINIEFFRMKIRMIL